MAPRKAVGEAEDFGVGELAPPVALQDNAAAARDLGDFGEADYQHAPVLADKGGGAIGQNADVGLFALARRSTCLPARACISASSLSRRKPHPSLAATSTFIRSRLGNIVTTSTPLGRSIISRSGSP